MRHDPEAEENLWTNCLAHVVALRTSKSCCTCLPHQNPRIYALDLQSKFSAVSSVETGPSVSSIDQVLLVISRHQWCAVQRTPFACMNVNPSSGIGHDLGPRHNASDVSRSLTDDSFTENNSEYPGRLPSPSRRPRTASPLIENLSSSGESRGIGRGARRGEGYQRTDSYHSETDEEEILNAWGIDEDEPDMVSKITFAHTVNFSLRALPEAS